MSDLKREHRAFNIIYSILRAILFPFYRLKTFGRENIPDGAAIFCGNHSSFLDPIFICFALTVKRPIHFIAKAEIFKVPVIGSVIRAIGTFPVDRRINDTSSIRTSLRYLKAGERIGLFPEGTRVSQAHAVAAKSGAVRLAAKTGAPIVPVYLPRKKSFLGTVTVVIGKPYYIHADKTLTHDDYAVLAGELMNRIEELGGGQLK